jgi:endoglucanase
VVLGLLRETAKKHEIAHVVHAVGRDTSTNADAIHIAREGVATGLVSIPNRYMHSPNEMVSLVDVDNAATLCAEFCRAITDDTDLTAR